MDPKSSPISILSLFLAAFPFWTFSPIVFNFASSSIVQMLAKTWMGEQWILTFSQGDNRIPNLKPQLEHNPSMTQQ